MNKSHLFLFSIISISAFSCSAMEIITPIISSTADTLSRFACDIYNANYPEQKNTKTLQENYRKALNNFNNNAEKLKKDTQFSPPRLQMAANLVNIRKDIHWIVNVINKKNNTPGERSLRIEYINKTIKILENINIPLEPTEITEYQEVINTIANFSIDKDHQVNLGQDSTSCWNEMLQNQKLLSAADATLLHLLNAKEIYKQEQQRKQKEDYEQRQLQAKIQQQERKAKIAAEKKEKEELARREEAAQLAKVKEEQEAQLQKEREEQELAREKEEQAQEIEEAAKLELIKKETEELIKQAKQTLKQGKAQTELLQAQGEQIKRVELAAAQLKEKIEQAKLKQAQEAYEKMAKNKEKEKKEAAQAKANKVKMTYLFTGVTVAGIIAYIIYLYKNNQLHTPLSPITYLMDAMIKTKNIGTTNNFDSIAA